MRHLLPCLVIGLASLAQQPAHAQTPLPDAPRPVTPLPGETEEQRKARLQAEGDREVDKQIQQRILTIVPNFNTVISGKSVPLSPRQKTRLAVRATLDPFNVVGAFVFGGVSELTGSNRGFGWGPGGYFKRVGANYLDVVNGTMLAGAVYPILFRQDPRYFRMGPERTVRARLLYALTSPFVCFGDNGHRQPNYSNVLGNFSSGALSNLYYPQTSQGIGLTLVSGGIVLIEGSLGTLGLEFSPDVAKWWHTRKERKAAARGAAASSENDLSELRSERPQPAPHEARRSASGAGTVPPESESSAR